MAIRVLLVDDHRILRDALRLALAREEGIEVVAEAGTAAEALDSAAALRPDVVVLDIRLPDLSGLGSRRACAACRSRHRWWRCRRRPTSASSRRCCAAAAQALRHQVVRGRAAGACGARRGRRKQLPLPRGGRCAGLRGARSVATRRIGRREHEVLRLLAGGARSPRSPRLHISPATVDVHRRNIMRKLDLHSVAELTRYAVREGIVAP